jgi:hypothetical protein
MSELGRVTVVIVALIALVALVTVAPQAVLIPIGVAFAAGLVASALIALVGHYPRVTAAPLAARDASAHGTTPRPR